MENLETVLREFEVGLDEIIKRTWESNDQNIHLAALVKGASSLAEKIIVIGDYSYDQLQAKDRGLGKDTLAFFIMNFLWPEYAKSFLILWRDIIFQQQKAQVLYRESQISEDAIHELKAQSLNVIRGAAEGLKSYLEKETSTITATRRGAQKAIRQWSLQINPWPTYKEQITELPKHCQYLDEQFGKQEKVLSLFHDIKQLVEETTQACKEEIAEMENLASNALQFIRDHIEEKPGKIPGHFENLEKGIVIQQHQTPFKRALEVKIEHLPDRLSIPVFIEEGIIRFKEVTFRRNAMQWLESEILPILYEIWEQTQSMSGGLKISLLNIRNRITLLTGESRALLQVDDIGQPIHAFLKTAKEQNFADLILLSQERLADNFQVSSVYNLQREFLPVPLQSTINQLRINQNRIFAFAQNRFGRLTEVAQRFIKRVEQEETLSLSEKIVRFIRNRSSNTNNSQYTSIFLTKGYIGESFWVGRQRELQHMESLIRQWKQGFRGAVVLSGKRFSGKSLFGEVVVNRYFPQKTVRVTPNSTINVQGRKFTTTYDLGAALEFIRKYTLNQGMVVWLDDLEFWGAPETPLAQNIRSLRRYIDNYSGQLFFLISMSNGLKVHLNKTHEIERVIQAEINLDRMSMAEVQEAILIRHGATHKTLVDEEGKEINPQQFKKMTTSIYKSSDGNVGEALSQWSYCTKKLDKDRVIHENRPNFALPDFINPDTALLLSAVMMEKKTNDYRLSKLFGPPFKDKYRGILQRLIGVGIITRDIDNWLEINELTVNEIGRQLEQKKYLKYSK